ncbi:MAG: response regulator [Dehalococcoidales bacterium]|nr:response regulator [Dehalococcoidales bacterium]
MVSRNRTILIVDDEPVVCDVLSEGLQEKGYLCDIAMNGPEALKKLAKENFALMLLDIRLPGMSGMEVLREIRFMRNNIATIMITAVSDVATVVEARKLGTLDYIVKPFDLDGVYTRIRVALEIGQAAEESSTVMEALARGVELTLDSFTAYSKLVTERTVAIAHDMGIAEEEIKQWIADKEALDSKRNRIIKLTA